MAKVLILDQSKSVRNILRERLEYEGFSAEAVENEAAASALCERIPFDVILSDTECKVPDAGIPFIALSADTSIDTAVKAAAPIGKGLYGVDLKLINGRAVVIEINDNPSIDHEVEDAVLGDELYYRILNHFVHCLNRLHAQ